MERAAGMVLHDKAHADISTQPNSPYGTRSKAVSSSTPNLSTPKAAKRWRPPSPILPTIRSNSPTATTMGGEWTSARETRDLSVSVHLGRCKGECYAFTRKAIATDTQEG